MHSIPLCNRSKIIIVLPPLSLCCVYFCVHRLCITKYTYSRTPICNLKFNYGLLGNLSSYSVKSFLKSMGGYYSRNNRIVLNSRCCISWTCIVKYLTFQSNLPFVITASPTGQGTVLPCSRA